MLSIELMSIKWPLHGLRKGCSEIPGVLRPCGQGWDSRNKQHGSLRKKRNCRLHHNRKSWGWDSSSLSLLSTNYPGTCLVEESDRRTRGNGVEPCWLQARHVTDEKKQLITGIFLLCPCIGQRVIHWSISCTCLVCFFLQGKLLQRRVV